MRLKHHKRELNKINVGKKINNKDEK